MVFLISHMASGDPASIILGDTATQEQIESLRESMGLNDPLIVQYFNWLINALHGDLGVSYYNGNSVVSNIADRLKPSLTLAVCAQIVAILLALPMGVF
ncbi:MAG: ABC transporter permease, partial [Lachnospiraceae bacterium]